jgi:tight adherence protein B
MDLVVFVGIAVLLLALATPFLILYQSRWSPQAMLRRRLATLGLARTHTGEGGETAARARQKLIQGKLRELEKQRNRTKRNSLRSLLLQAGLSWSVPLYIGIGVGTGLLAAVALLAFGFSPLICLAGGGGAGLGLPRMILNSMVKKRQSAFTAHFGDALDILVRGTRTGLPVNECLRIVGREVPDPVGFEFRMLVESQRVGMSTEQALERALERMPTSDFQFFSVVLIIQQQTGGNLAATLENLSGVLRSRRRLREKVQAMSSEAKASAGIIGSLPFAVATLIGLVNPAYMSLLFTTKMGNYLIAGGLAWMTLGVLVMRQMINFKI